MSHVSSHFPCTHACTMLRASEVRRDAAHYVRGASRTGVDSPTPALRRPKIMPRIRWRVYRDVRLDQRGLTLQANRGGRHCSRTSDSDEVLGSRVAAKNRPGQNR